MSNHLARISLAFVQVLSAGGGHVEHVFNVGLVVEPKARSGLLCMAGSFQVIPPSGDLRRAICTSDDFCFGRILVSTNILNRTHLLSTIAFQAP